MVAEAEEDLEIVKGIFEDGASETRKYSGKISSKFEEKLDVLVDQLEQMNEMLEGELEDLSMELEGFVAGDLRDFESIRA